jgi:hypothetical protein
LRDFERRLRRNKEDKAAESEFASCERQAAIGKQKRRDNGSCPSNVTQSKTFDQAVMLDIYQ